MDVVAHYVVVGGGIVGLATALAVADAHPRARVTVIDKEQRWAAHQTGRNSGVIHSGIYYKAGTLKANLCLAGSRSMVAFCERHDIPVEVCGKLIVATDSSELPGLAALEERAGQHGIPVERLDASGIPEREPFVAGIAALHVRSTGITDYAAVCGAMVGELERRGGELRLGERVDRVVDTSGGVRVETDRGVLEADVAVNCAGLQSDRMAARSGSDLGARIVPFRGEYFELVPERRHLVRHLVYPVPDPAFPFLGVHFTRGVDGSVHAGPNAVLALAREGYRWSTIRPADLYDVLGYRGFWRLARRHALDGGKEMFRSVWKPAFVRSLQRLVPEVCSADLVRAPAGVRAQALLSDGSLVDDFLIVTRGRTLHVGNAPSPAATSSLEIGRYIAGQLPSPDDL